MPLQAEADPIPWWVWAIGLGVGTGIIGTVVYLNAQVSKAATVTSGGGGGGTVPPAINVTKPSTDVTIPLNPGNATVGVTPGANVILTLPAGATWIVPASANNGQAVFGSAPGSGSNPASFLYKGGGCLVLAEWKDATGTSQSVVITVSDA